MPKIMKIEFDVDMAKGELPYRSYVSSEPVKDSMFVLASKLTNEDEVFYMLVQCPISGDGEPNKLMEKTVSHEEFKQAVALLESDLQQAVPSVKMNRQQTGNFAFSDQGPIEDGGLLADMLSKGFGSDGKDKLKEMAETIANVAPSHPLAGLASQLVNQLNSGQIDRAQLMATATTSGEFSVMELINLFAGLSPEERSRVNQILAQMKGVDLPDHPMFKTPNQGHQNNPHSNNRLNKYL